MDFLESSFIGMKIVLAESGDSVSEGYVDGFIEELRSSGTTDKFIKAFSKDGAFADFSFSPAMVPDEEKRFWCTQLFGGLVAMALQLDKFTKAGRKMTVDFMRKNFGHPAEVISGVKCTACGAKEICRADIDKYVTPPVVSKAIIDGLEGSCIGEKIRELLDGTSEHLRRERSDAALRADNSNVSVSECWRPSNLCSKCGKAALEKCRFLKSIKTKSFVSLSR